MKVIIFEDDKPDLLFPISMMRPVYDVKPGALSLIERTSAALGKDASRIRIHSRTYLRSYLTSLGRNVITGFGPEDYILLNGRFIFEKKFLKRLLKTKPETRFFKSGDSVAFATIRKEDSVRLNDRLPNALGVIDEVFLISCGVKNGGETSETVSEIRYPWDAVSYMLRQGLNEDLKNMGDKAGRRKKTKNFVNEDMVCCSVKTSISNMSVLDASEGKIVIEEGCTIEPFVFVKGPAYIGKNVLIKSGTRIYGPCVIGDGSKVAGEIAESVLHSYVNKQHDGFVGHSYICPFVNLGADTVTSDLKNNYSAIKQKFRGGMIDTGMRFLGSIIGDHSKTSINTMLNTGTIAGIFANIFGGGFPSKEIASFSWNESGKPAVRYDFDKAMETAGIVMSRRGMKLSEEYLSLARHYFDSGNFSNN
ncbi:MAG: hypothetical protein K1X85_13290 [Ignavibacteria bacterium]|nr:hypothetical protein [Ignavibacteria bacterium]